MDLCVSGLESWAPKWTIVCFQMEFIISSFGPNIKARKSSQYRVLVEGNRARRKGGVTFLVCKAE